MNRFLSVSGLAAGIALVLVGQAAYAQSATINAARFGVYQSFTDIASFDHSPDTGDLPRYDVGASTPVVLIRNYFTFDLASVNFTVTGATLRIFSPGTPSVDPSPQINTLNIFDISTPLANVTDTTPSQGVGDFGAIFADLGEGTLYGTTLLDSSAINGTTEVDIPLTGALADINAAGTGAFGVGGALVIPDNINQALYFSGGTREPFAQLILTGQSSAAPEPGTVALTLAALPTLGLLLRRRR